MSLGIIPLGLESWHYTVETICPLSLFLTSITLCFLCWAEIISLYNWCTVVSIWYEECVSVAYKRATRMTAILIAKSDGGVERAIPQMNRREGRKVSLLNPCSILGTYTHEYSDSSQGPYDNDINFPKLQKHKWRCRKLKWNVLGLSANDWSIWKPSPNFWTWNSYSLHHISQYQFNYVNHSDPSSSDA